MATDRFGCVVQFAKAPVPGRVKTRLQPVLGAEGAALLAEHLLRDVVRCLAAVPAGWDSVLCVDDPGHPFFRYLLQGKGSGALPQGDGSLGERMRRACVRVLGEYPAVVLVGSDCLGYDAGYLGMACRLLEAGTPAVLGPAIDGGYVLIGLRSFPDGLMEGIAWGGADVARDQRGKFLACGLRWSELPPRADVDRAGDLWMLEDGPWRRSGERDGAVVGLASGAPGAVVDARSLVSLSAHEGQ
jgi:rSAM/selenodomain-associated transferase 1